MQVTLALMAAVAVSGTAFAAPSLDIVRDGRAAASVVVAPGASEQVRGAVQVLVSCVQEASGAELPLVEAAPETGTVIHVGPSAAVEAFGIDQAGLDEDGFDIAFPDERTLVILGPTDWGTEFGVQEFLERYVGVRWLLPGPDGTDIPAQATILAPAEPVRQEPAFVSRLFSGLRGGVQAEWARRNRMRGRVSFHHNLLRLFPPETYTATHPEFFPVHDGERFLPPTNNTHRWQPCFTAPGIVEEAIRNIVRFFDENPHAPSYSLGANDSSGYCRCEECLARISGEHNFLGRVDYSDLYYDWANRVIEGVLEKHPDKFFGCLAYSEVAAPPMNVEVHPRLIPYMTYDRMKWVEADLRAEGEAMTRAWQARSPTLGWYDYIYGTPYVLPRVWFHHMADYYRFGHAHGVRALYAEAYPNWGEGPKLYVSLKLQWDPGRDVDELLDDWYTRCVGEQAAPDLAAYYAHWEDFWTRRVLDSRWFTRGGQYLNFSSPLYLHDISLDEIRESRRLLENVVAGAQTDRQQARAQLLLDAFEYYEATAFAFKADDIATDEPLTTAQQALGAIDDAVHTAHHALKRRRLALEVFPDHPVLVHPLSIERRGTLSGETWGAGGLWRVYDIAAQGEGPVRERIRSIARGGPDITRGLQDQAAMMLLLIEDEREPLTANHSFEEGVGAAATDWGWWVRAAGRMSRTDEVAHTGDYSILCDGMDRGGPVQVLDITPGRYGLVCFVYVPEGQESRGTVELAMIFRDEHNRNLPSPSTKMVPPAGRWTAVAVAGEAPARIGDDEVRKMLPILIVDGFAEGERVYLDDLALYRLD